MLICCSNIWHNRCYFFFPHCVSTSILYIQYMKHGFMLCSKKAEEELQKKHICWGRCFVTLCLCPPEYGMFRPVTNIVQLQFRRLGGQVCVPTYFICGKTETTWPLQYGSRSGTLAVKRCMTQRHSAHLPCLLSLHRKCVCAVHALIWRRGLCFSAGIWPQALCVKWRWTLHNFDLPCFLYCNTAANLTLSLSSLSLCLST